MIKEEDIQKAKDATFPIPEGGRSYEQSLAASGFELGARWASALNEPNISFKEQMIRSCIEIALTDVIEKRFSDYGTSLKECLEWIEEQQNKIAFYEKQGKQKPFDYEHNTITQKDFAPEDKCAGCNNIKGCIACVDGNNWAHYYYEDEQKSINDTDEEIAEAVKDTSILDMVEPKFKIGDWIARGNVKSQIIGIEDNKYYFNGYKVRCSTIDKHYHLWTIDDAKDGDVLAGKIDGDDYILIFKQIKDGWIETYGHYYNAVNRFCVPSQLFCRNYQGTFTPANEERRDTLMKAIAEAGYEWDNEKKELKLLITNCGDFVPQQEWSEEDEEMTNDLIEGLLSSEKTHYLVHTSKEIANWLKSLKDRVNGKEEKK